MAQLCLRVVPPVQLTEPEMLIPAPVTVPEHMKDMTNPALGTVPELR